MKNRSLFCSFEAPEVGNLEHSKGYSMQPSCECLGGLLADSRELHKAELFL